MAEPNGNGAISELRFFRVISLVLATLMLGVVGYIAINSASIPTIKYQVDELSHRFDETTSWESKKFDDHENRIRDLENKENRRANR